MESLNLKTLANSLPTAQQNAEKDLLNDFKAAALSITNLYRSSRDTSKRAYNTGYGAACQDLLTFVQQGVSTSDLGSDSLHAVDGRGMTIGRVMDWTEARLEAIRSTEEEEEEEEEREKDRTAGQPSRSSPPSQTPSSPRTTNRKLLAPRPKGSVSINPSKLPSVSSPPTPPPSVSSTIGAKPLRPRTAPPQPNVSHTPSFLTDGIPTATSSMETPIVIGAGTKRRHAMMMMLDSASSPMSLAHGSGPSSFSSSPNGINIPGAATSSLGRRRHRNPRNINQNQNINVIQVTPEEMDVEEDGRERKRVARRG